MQIFENGAVQPQPKGKVRGHDTFDVTLVLKEKPVRTYDGDFEWGLGKLHSKLPVPIPSQVVPGGSIVYEDRDFAKTGDTIAAQVCVARCTWYFAGGGTHSVSAAASSQAHAHMNFTMQGSVATV